jgi:hypothetical protein
MFRPKCGILLGLPRFLGAEGGHFGKAALNESS